MIPRFAAAVLVLPLTATAAPTGKDPAAPPDEALALIPPKAIATVQINGLGRVQDRLDKLLKAAAPDRADQASKAVRDAIADALAGRDTRALRPDGRVLIAIADVEKLPDDATLTFLFPVKSGDDFRAQFLTEEERKSLKKDGDLESVQWEDRKEPFYLANLTGYVVVSSDKAAATAYAKGEIGGVARQLSAETARTFLDADVGLFVNVREVNAKYGDQLKTVKSLADLFLKGDSVQGVSKAQLEQIKGIIEAAFTVVEHGTAAVLAAEFRPDGLALRGLAQFADNSATAEALKKYKPAELPELGVLPVGQMAYSASVLQAGRASALMDSFVVDDADPAAKETIDGLKKELAAYDRGLTLATGKMTGATLETIESKDAAKIVTARLGMLKALTRDGSFGGVPLKAKPDVTEKAETVGGFALHRARFSYDFDKAVADLPEDQREAARASARRTLGGDESAVWLGTDGKTVLQLAAREWADAKALAEAYLSKAAPLAKDEAYQFTRKHLPAEATMLVILDTAQTAYSLYGVFRGATGAVPGFPKAVPDARAPPGSRRTSGSPWCCGPGTGGSSCSCRRRPWTRSGSWWNRCWTTSKLPKPTDGRPWAFPEVAHEALSHPTGAAGPGRVLQDSRAAIDHDPAARREHPVDHRPAQRAEGQGGGVVRPAGQRLDPPGEGRAPGRQGRLRSGHDEGRGAGQGEEHQGRNPGGDRPGQGEVPGLHQQPGVEGGQRDGEGRQSVRKRYRIRLPNSSIPFA